MTKETLQYGILFAFMLVYCIYTTRFALSFRKTLLFTGKVKNFHLVMIWLIPFCWIFLLHSLIKSTPGSFEIKDKSNPDSSTESGLGNFIDSSIGTDS
jgi:hypothetical protein